MKKLTQQQIQLRLNRLNLLLLSEYINNYTEVNIKCYCGKTFSVMPMSIFAGKTISCGCFRKQKISEIYLKDMIGKEYGYFKVLELLPKQGKRRKYKCICKCGQIKEVLGENLRSGNSSSCGCKNSNPTLTPQQKLRSRGGRGNYDKWTKLVFIRDHFTCQKCKVVGGYLIAHHLNGWHWCIEQRFDLDNGATLCINCHNIFHKRYGKRNNTKVQYQEFLIS